LPFNERKGIGKGKGSGREVEEEGGEIPP